MQRKKARKAGGWGSEIKGWDTQKGGINYKGGGGSYPSAHCEYEDSQKPWKIMSSTPLFIRNIFNKGYLRI